MNITKYTPDFTLANLKTGHFLFFQKMYLLYGNLLPALESAINFSRTWTCFPLFVPAGDILVLNAREPAMC